MGVVRARRGVGTHWQPLNTKPGLCSGEETRARAGVGGGGGVGAGGCGHALAAFKLSLDSKHSKNATRCG